MRAFPFLIFGLFFTPSLFAKSFETFDGRIYNGLYYPVVDAIEWGEQNGELPHMEFHIHSKDKPVDLTVVPGEKGGRPVLWLMYSLKFRDERICRHILAPVHFKEGMALYTYRDNASDPDFDNIFVSSEPMQGKNLVPYQMDEYRPCLDENASNKPDSQPRALASVPEAAPASPAAPEKKDGKNVGVDYDNQAVPFSF